MKEWCEGALFVEGLLGPETVVKLAGEAVEQVALGGVVPVEKAVPKRPDSTCVSRRRRQDPAGRRSCSLPVVASLRSLPAA